ncbi:MAG: nickel pincer cofactor biosynthesis protein LarC [Verrucomicrobiota bacterium]|nr:nickel pincer cofactor biosynthesis protein LarC [Verrucomicrobiota bacterium]
MKKILYLDCFSGISGDMLMGALADLGVKPSAFEWELTKLDIGDFHMHFDRKFKGAIEGVKFSCHEGKVHTHAQDEKDGDHGHDHSHDHGEECGHDHPHEEGHHHHDHPHDHEDGGCDHEHDHPHVEGHDHDHDEGHHHSHDESRNYSQIRDLIEKSSLSPFVKKHAVGVFHRVAVAEGKIHGLPPEKVHFHEVGALDSILDIVGACIGIEALGVDEVHASALQEGHGFLECAHGRFPIPSTATLEILQGIPLSQTDEPYELITPTGAAILAEFSKSFGLMNQLSTVRVGYGLGTRNLQSRPNVLRAVLANVPGESAGPHTDTVVVIETNLDDVTPEIIGHVLTESFQAGALDAWSTPVQMKKNRPGVLLSLLTEPSRADELARWLMRETGSFGVRYTHYHRSKLHREIKTVQTTYGPVEVKIGRDESSVVVFSPEYESCRKIAEKGKVPVRLVYEAALKAVKAD